MTAHDLGLILISGGIGFILGAWWIVSCFLDKDD